MVNSTGRANREVANTASVRVGNSPAQDTNTIRNPVTPGSSRSRGGSGGGSGSGGSSGGGSGSGGPGDSGGSEGGGDVWDLLPLPSTGQGWAMLIGASALLISAMALIVLLWLKRKESKS